MRIDLMSFLWLAVVCLSGCSRNANSSRPTTEAIGREGGIAEVSGSYEISFDGEKAQSIVQSITNGNVVANGEGVVGLALQQKSLSVNGKAYVTKTSGDAVGILLVTWIGKGANLRGYFFSTSPLAMFDLEKGSDDSPTIQIIAPSPESPPKDAAKVRVEIEDTEIKDWFRVSADSD